LQTYPDGFCRLQYLSLELNQQDVSSLTLFFHSIGIGAHPAQGNKYGVSSIRKAKRKRGISSTRKKAKSKPNIKPQTT